MSLQSKILHLKLEAALAVKHANGWQRLIDLYGEEKATAFYAHLGLNHLPQKSYDFDGLSLSREPKPHEALQVKAIAAAQESAKERLAAMMGAIRKELINQALDQLVDLPPAKYHTLIVSVDSAGRTLLRDLVGDTFTDGRLLIQTQRGSKQDDDIDLDEELDELTDITASRLANDVQSRITGAASRFALLGQAGQELINSVSSEINEGSIAYVDRAATGLANRTLNMGRSAEADRFQWERVEYSAILDTNVCGPCAASDGETANNEDDLQPAPNPECEGGDWCRCFHVFVEA